MKYICFFVLSIWLLQSGSASAQRLKEEQIRMLVTGATVEGISANNGNPYTIQFHADLRTTGLLQGNTNTIDDTGRWWAAKGRLLCLQWAKFAKGRKM